MSPQVDEMIQCAVSFSLASKLGQQEKTTSRVLFSTCPAGLFFISRNFVTNFGNIDDIPGSLFLAAGL